MRIGFIGAGKVGFTLGRYFVEHNVCVSGYYSHSLNSAREAAQFTNTQYYSTIDQIVNSCDTLLLTVPDNQIGAVYSELQESDIEGKSICHCSGALSSEIFRGIEERGAYAYSIHPIFAVSSKLTSYQELSQAYFTIEGTPAHLEDMAAFIRSLGNQVSIIAAADKVKYHAAAVFASNLMVGLYEEAVGLLLDCNLQKEFASHALLPLMENNVSNIVSGSTVEALTGPVERADSQTVERHLQVLEGRERKLYCLLSEQLIDIAKKKNPDRDYGTITQLLDQED